VSLCLVLQLLVGGFPHLVLLLHSHKVDSVAPSWSWSLVLLLNSHKVDSVRSLVLLLHSCKVDSVAPSLIWFLVLLQRFRSVWCNPTECLEEQFAILLAVR